MKMGACQDVTMSLDNGLHERYFNLEYSTEDGRINELLEYFKDSDPYYQTENFPRIVERVKYYKIQKEGVNIMCEIADRIRREGMEKGRQEGIKEGRQEGIKEGRQEGMEKGIKEGIKEGIIESLKNLVKNANMTLEQAMAVLEIPENDRLMYAGRVKQ